MAKPQTAPQEVRPFFDYHEETGPTKMVRYTNNFGVATHVPKRLSDDAYYLKGDNTGEQGWAEGWYKPNKSGGLDRLADQGSGFDGHGAFKYEGADGPIQTAQRNGDNAVFLHPDFAPGYQKGWYDPSNWQKVGDDQGTLSRAWGHMKSGGHGIGMAVKKAYDAEVQHQLNTDMESVKAGESDGGAYLNRAADTGQRLATGVFNKVAGVPQNVVGAYAWMGGKVLGNPALSRWGSNLIHGNVDGTQSMTGAQAEVDMESIGNQLKAAVSHLHTLQAQGLTDQDAEVIKAKQYANLLATKMAPLQATATQESLGKEEVENYLSGAGETYGKLVGEAVGFKGMGMAGEALGAAANVTGLAAKIPGLKAGGTLAQSAKLAEEAAALAKSATTAEEIVQAGQVMKAAQAAAKAAQSLSKPSRVAGRLAQGGAMSMPGTVEGTIHSMGDPNASVMDVAKAGLKSQALGAVSFAPMLSETVRPFTMPFAQDTIPGAAGNFLSRSTALGTWNGLAGAALTGDNLFESMPSHLMNIGMWEALGNFKGIKGAKAATKDLGAHASVLRQLMDPNVDVKALEGAPISEQEKLRIAALDGIRRAYLAKTAESVLAAAPYKGLAERRGLVGEAKKALVEANTVEEGGESKGKEVTKNGQVQTETQGGEEVVQVGGESQEPKGPEDPPPPPADAGGQAPQEPQTRQTPQAPQTPKTPAQSPSQIALGDTVPRQPRREQTAAERGAKANAEYEAFLARQNGEEPPPPPPPAEAEAQAAPVAGQASKAMEELRRVQQSQAAPKPKESLQEEAARIATDLSDDPRASLTHGWDDEDPEAHVLRANVGNQSHRTVHRTALNAITTDPASAAKDIRDFVDTEKGFVHPDEASHIRRLARIAELEAQHPESGNLADLRGVPDSVLHFLGDPHEARRQAAHVTNSELENHNRVLRSMQTPEYRQLGKQLAIGAQPILDKTIKTLETTFKTLEGHLDDLTLTGKTSWKGNEKPKTPEQIRYLLKGLQTNLDHYNSIYRALLTLKANTTGRLDRIPAQIAAEERERFPPIQGPAHSPGITGPEAKTVGHTQIEINNWRKTRTKELLEGLGLKPEDMDPNSPVQAMVRRMSRDITSRSESVYPSTLASMERSRDSYQASLEYSRKQMGRAYAAGDKENAGRWKEKIDIYGDLVRQTEDRLEAYRQGKPDETMIQHHAKYLVKQATLERGSRAKLSDLTGVGGRPDPTISYASGTHERNGSTARVVIGRAKGGIGLATSDEMSSYAWQTQISKSASQKLMQADGLNPFAIPEPGTQITQEIPRPNGPSAPVGPSTQLPNRRVTGITRIVDGKPVIEPINLSTPRDSGGYYDRAGKWIPPATPNFEEGLGVTPEFNPAGEGSTAKDGKVLLGKGLVGTHLGLAPNQVAGDGFVWTKNQDGLWVPLSPKEPRAQVSAEATLEKNRKTIRTEGVVNNHYDIAAFRRQVAALATDTGVKGGIIPPTVTPLRHQKWGTFRKYQIGSEGALIPKEIQRITIGSTPKERWTPQEPAPPTNDFGRALLQRGRSAIHLTTDEVLNRLFTPKAEGQPSVAETLAPRELESIIHFLDSRDLPSMYESETVGIPDRYTDTAAKFDSDLRTKLDVTGDRRDYHQTEAERAAQNTHSEVYRRTGLAQYDAGELQRKTDEAHWRHTAARGRDDRGVAASILGELVGPRSEGGLFHPDELALGDAAYRSAAASAKAEQAAEGRKGWKPAVEPLESVRVQMDVEEQLRDLPDAVRGEAASTIEETLQGLRENGAFARPAHVEGGAEVIDTSDHRFMKEMSPVVRGVDPELADIIDQRAANKSPKAVGEASITPAGLRQVARLLRTHGISDTGETHPISGAVVRPTTGPHAEFADRIDKWADKLGNRSVTQDQVFSALGGFGKDGQIALHYLESLNQRSSELDIPAPGHPDRQRYLEAYGSTDELMASRARMMQTVALEEAARRLYAQGTQEGVEGAQRLLDLADGYANKGDRALLQAISENGGSYWEPILEPRDASGFNQGRYMKPGDIAALTNPFNPKHDEYHDSLFSRGAEAPKKPLMELLRETDETEPFDPLGLGKGEGEERDADVGTESDTPNFDLPAEYMNMATPTLDRQMDQVGLGRLGQKLVRQKGVMPTTTPKPKLERAGEETPGRGVPTRAEVMKPLAELEGLPVGETEPAKPTKGLWANQRPTEAEPAASTTMSPEEYAAHSRSLLNTQAHDWDKFFGKRGIADRQTVEALGKAGIEAPTEEDIANSLRSNATDEEARQATVSETIKRISTRLDEIIRQSPLETRNIVSKRIATLRQSESPADKATVEAYDKTMAEAKRMFGDDHDVVSFLQHFDPHAVATLNLSHVNEDGIAGYDFGPGTIRLRNGFREMLALKKGGAVIEFSHELGHWINDHLDPDFLNRQFDQWANVRAEAAKGNGFLDALFKATGDTPMVADRIRIDPARAEQLINALKGKGDVAEAARKLGLTSEKLAAAIKDGSVDWQTLIDSAPKLENYYHLVNPDEMFAESMADLVAGHRIAGGVSLLPPEMQVGGEVQASLDKLHVANVLAALKGWGGGRGTTNPEMLRLALEGARKAMGSTERRGTSATKELRRLMEKVEATGAPTPYPTEANDPMLLANADEAKSLRPKFELGGETKSRLLEAGARLKEVTVDPERPGRRHYSHDWADHLEAAIEAGEVHPGRVNRILSAFGEWAKNRQVLEDFWGKNPGQLDIFKRIDDNNHPVRKEEKRLQDLVPHDKYLQASVTSPHLLHHEDVGVEELRTRARGALQSAKTPIFKDSVKNGLVYVSSWHNLCLGTTDGTMGALIDHGLPAYKVHMGTENPAMEIKPGGRNTIDHYSAATVVNGIPYLIDQPQREMVAPHSKDQFKLLVPEYKPRFIKIDTESLRAAYGDHTAAQAESIKTIIMRQHESNQPLTPAQDEAKSLRSMGMRIASVYDEWAERGRKAAESSEAGRSMKAPFAGARTFASADTLSALSRAVGGSGLYLDTRDQAEMMHIEKQADPHVRKIAAWLRQEHRASIERDLPDLVYDAVKAGKGREKELRSGKIIKSLSLSVGGKIVRVTADRRGNILRWMTKGEMDLYDYIESNGTRSELSVDPSLRDSLASFMQIKRESDMAMRGRVEEAAGAEPGSMSPFWVENYLAHVYATTNQKGTMNSLFPDEGDSLVAFDRMQKRTMATYSQAWQEMGLLPRALNPLDNFLQGHRDMMKIVGLRRLLTIGQNADFVKLEHGSNVDDNGWVRLNLGPKGSAALHRLGLMGTPDALLRNDQPMPEIFVRREAEGIFKSLYHDGLSSSSTWGGMYRKYMALSGILAPAKLGLSGFHVGTVAKLGLVEGAHQGLALYNDLVNRGVDRTEAAKRGTELLLHRMNWNQMLKQGRQTRELFVEHGSKTTAELAETKGLTDMDRMTIMMMQWGGYSPQVHPGMQRMQRETLLDALEGAKQGSISSAASVPWHLYRGGLESFQSVIMDDTVSPFKVAHLRDTLREQLRSRYGDGEGVFEKFVADFKDERTGGPYRTNELRELAKNTVSHHDDVFGMVNYRALMQHPYMRDAMKSWNLSYGWRLGTLRILFKGLDEGVSMVPGVGQAYKGTKRAMGGTGIQQETLGQHGQLLGGRAQDTGKNNLGFMAMHVAVNAAMAGAMYALYQGSRGILGAQIGSKDQEGQDKNGMIDRARQVFEDLMFPTFSGKLNDRSQSNRVDQGYVGEWYGLFKNPTEWVSKHVAGNNPVLQTAKELITGADEIHQEIGDPLFLPHDASTRYGKWMKEHPGMAEVTKRGVHLVNSLAPISITTAARLNRQNEGWGTLAASSALGFRTVSNNAAMGQSEMAAAGQAQRFAGLSKRGEEVKDVVKQENKNREREIVSRALQEGKPQLLDTLLDEEIWSDKQLKAAKNSYFEEADEEGNAKARSFEGRVWNEGDIHVKTAMLEHASKERVTQLWDDYLERVKASAPKMVPANRDETIRRANALADKYHLERFE
jgi:hypothetical protein